MNETIQKNPERREGEAGKMKDRIRNAVLAGLAAAVMATYAAGCANNTAKDDTTSPSTKEPQITAGTADASTEKPDGGTGSGANAGDTNSLGTSAPSTSEEASKAPDKNPAESEATTTDPSTTEEPAVDPETKQLADEVLEKLDKLAALAYLTYTLDENKDYLNDYSAQFKQLSPEINWKDYKGYPNPLPIYTKLMGSYYQMTVIYDYNSNGQSYKNAFWGPGFISEETFDKLAEKLKINKVVIDDEMAAELEEITDLDIQRLKGTSVYKYDKPIDRKAINEMDLETLKVLNSCVDEMFALNFPEFPEAVSLSIDEILAMFRR